MDDRRSKTVSKVGPVLPAAVCHESVLETRYPLAELGEADAGLIAPKHFFRAVQRPNPGCSHALLAFGWRGSGGGGRASGAGRDGRGTVAEAAIAA